MSEQMPKIEVVASQVNDETRDWDISREKQTEKLLSFLDRLDTDDVFGSEIKKMEFIQELNFDEFKNWLVRLNGISRDIPIRERGLSENYQSFGDRVTFPLPEDKDALLSKLFDKIKTQENTEDIAQLLTVGINYIHPFVDGNGRTGRLVYILIAKDYIENKKEKEKTIEFISDGRDKILDTSLFIEYAESIQEKQIGIDREKIFDCEKNLLVDRSEYATKLSIRGGRELIFQDEVSEKNKNFLKYLIENNETTGLSFLLLRSFLIDKNKLEEYTKEFPARKVIDVEKLVKVLTNDDVENIREMYSKIISERFDIVMDIMTEPQRYIITEKKTWEDESVIGMTVKDYIITRVANK